MLKFNFFVGKKNKFSPVFRGMASCFPRFSPNILTARWRKLWEIRGHITENWRKFVKYIQWHQYWELANAELNHMSEPKERSKCEVNEVIRRPFVQQFLFYWIVVVEVFFSWKIICKVYTDSNLSCRCNCKLQSNVSPLKEKSPTYSEIVIRGSIMLKNSRFYPPSPQHTSMSSPAPSEPVSQPYSKDGQRLPCRGKHGGLVLHQHSMSNVSLWKIFDVRPILKGKYKVITLICFIHYNKPESGWQNVFYFVESSSEIGKLTSLPLENRRR